MILNIVPPVLLSIAFIYNSANNNIKKNDNQYSNDGMTSNDNIGSIKKKKKETKDSKSHEDTFEENKQKYEAIGLICSYICIYCSKYYINVVVFVISYGILQFYIEW